MTARELVEHLQARGAEVRRVRDGDYMAQCPAHDDRTPSLHVTDRDGKVLLSCQAGCESLAVVEAAGLDWDALFHESRNGGREIVATYDYTDPDGRLVFQAVRYWPKDFRQRQPDGAGGWTWNIEGCTRWLYRMPRVIEALERRERLKICEGEKDADALDRLGLYATTNPMGAGKWRDEHAQMLVGATAVSVIRDRDEKGVAHAEAVVASLRRVGIEPTLLEPREGKDVSEHLAAGHSWEALREVALGAENVATAEADVPKRLELVDMSAAIARADDPLPAVIEGVAYAGSVTVLVGKHSAGKSMLALAWGTCCHRADGEDREVAGIRCEHATTLYLDSENGPLLMGRRFRDAGIPADGLVMAVPRAGFRLHQHLTDLRQLIKTTGAKLVVLDALRRLAPGARENESEDMAPLLAGLAEIARELEVAIVVLHHRSTKPGAATMRGSSAIEDQADIVVSLERRGDRRKLTAKKFRLGSRACARLSRHGLARRRLRLRPCGWLGCALSGGRRRARRRPRHRRP